MKKCLLALFSYGCCLAAAAQPDNWQQKNDLGWYTPHGPTNRMAAIGFSIGSKAFIGTGFDNQERNDFWQYDSLTDSWSQKADFGGAARRYATGFSIGNKGYIGLGTDGYVGHYNDFWEYDTAANSWTRKADFGGSARKAAVGFSIGSKGYIGTGVDNARYYNDFWEYDQAADQWTQKANFGGMSRWHACGFSIDGKGYIGTGENDGVRPIYAFFSDLWQYDTAADSWTRKADFGGGDRAQAVGFSIGGKGYMGSGTDFTEVFKNDFWQYDPVADSWTKQSDFGGTTRYAASGFGLGNRGYIMGGFDGANRNDLWKFDPVANSWKQKANFGAGARSKANGFSIGAKGYVGMGVNVNHLLNDFWEYDQATGSWTQKANCPDSAIGDAISFSIGSMGYTGLGDTSGTYRNDFWQFDPAANTWTRKANFAGGGRESATGFSIGNKGYAGLGMINEASQDDFWEYDPATDAWTQKSNFGGGPRYEAKGFSIGSKGYLLYGRAILFNNDFWQYDPGADSWTQKAPFGGSPRADGVVFEIGGKGYAGTGSSNVSSFSDLWEYDTAADSWIQKTNFPGGLREGAVAFSIGNKGYIGTGGGAVISPPINTRGSAKSDFWEYSSQADVRTSSGDYSVISGCPALSGTALTYESDNTGNLIFGINPGNNNLGSVCWGIRNAAAGSYRDTYGWFGGSQPQFGAYLPRNYVIMPTTEPTAAVTLRLYCTAQELTDFISYFNTRYGTSYTSANISILRYDGINQDLDLGNNSAVAADYTALTPSSIGMYGSSGEYRYFEFSTTSLSEFSIVLSSASNPLALKIIEFSASYAGGASLLNWKTAQEQNTSLFTVQRSTDGKNFTDIGSMPAAGTSSALRNYDYTDYSAGSLQVPVIWYRLQETDLDGSITFSRISSVQTGGTEKGILVSPNPATSNINMELNTEIGTGGTLLITDLAGKRLLTRPINLHVGNNSIPVAIGEFSAGVYSVTITTPQAKWQTKFEKL